MENNPRLIFHAHIPKTAGLAFRGLLEQNFPGRFVSLQLAHPQQYCSVPEFEEYLRANPKADAVSTHFLRIFPETLAGRKVLYLTFLRDPLGLTLSLFRFLRKSYPSLSDEQKRTLPQGIESMSLRDIARFHIENWFDERQQFSMQTAFFSPIPNVRLNERPPGYGFYGKDSLVDACAALNRFFFVGLVERMPESLLLLQHKLNRNGIPFEAAGMKVVNSTDRAPGEETWLHDNDAVGRIILNANRSDQELYRLFSDKFQAELKKAGITGG
ncbi:MAG TPA: hypothetical protein VGD78_21380 [Chthoniobacterales bacterium]